MSIPEDIENKILSYVHLEFGEDPKSPNALKLEDLLYEGAFETAGILKHYWKCGENNEIWATVELFEESYCLGITSSPPTPSSQDYLYECLCIQDFDRSLDIKLPVKEFLKYVDVSLPDGGVISVYAEAHTASSPVSVTIGIKEQGRGCYIRASVGIAMSYTTNNGIELILSIGKGPW